MYWLTHYTINWDKVETLDDLKEIVKALQIAFEPDHPAVGRVKFLEHRDKKTGELVPLTPNAPQTEDSAAEA